MEKYLTKKEILKATNIKYYTLDYLFKIGYIEADSFGKGRPRHYSQNTIAKIEEWKQEKGLEK